MIFLSDITYEELIQSNIEYNTCSNSCKKSDITYEELIPTGRVSMSVRTAAVSDITYEELILPVSRYNSMSDSSGRTLPMRN